MKLLQQEYSNFSFSASEAFRKKSTRTNRIRTKRDRIYVVKRTQTVTKKGMFALNEFALFEHRTNEKLLQNDRVLGASLGAILQFYRSGVSCFTVAVGDPKKAFLLNMLASRVDRGRLRGSCSFGLIVLEAENSRSSNQVKIEILLCKLTLQIPKMVLDFLQVFKQKSFISKILGFF